MEEPEGPRVDVAFSENRETVTLRFSSDVMSINADQLTDLLRGLAKTRSQMSPEFPSDLPLAAHPLIADPRYFVASEPLTSGAALLLRHPGLGFLGFQIPRHEIPELTRRLNECIAQAPPESRPAN